MKRHVISLRLEPRQMKQVEELAREEQKEKSTLTRELITCGLMLKMLRLYRQGKASLGYLADRLSLPTGEVLDLLAEFGMESSMTYEDYLQGLTRPRKATRRRRAAKR